VPKLGAPVDCRRWLVRRSASTWKNHSRGELLDRVLDEETAQVTLEALEGGSASDLPERSPELLHVAGRVLGPGGSRSADYGLFEAALAPPSGTRPFGKDAYHVPRCQGRRAAAPRWRAIMP